MHSAAARPTNDVACATPKPRPAWPSCTPVWTSSTPGHPSSSKLAGALRYSLKRWPALTRYADDGRLEIDNNAAERALRSVAVERKNYLFAGSDSGGERAAIIYTLIETAKLSDVNPYAWLTDVISRIADHPARELEELLPWAWAPR